MRKLTGALAFAAVLATTAVGFAAEPKPAFELPPLPYAANALEPVIDAKTMEIHHGKHHQAYVTGLNKAIAADKALEGKSLEELLAKAGTLPAAVRNNAGGHWNHSQFWKSMKAPGTGGKPADALAKAIETKFGSIDEFKQKFQTAGVGRFGSGWVWLIVTPGGELEITSTPNQDNPLMDVAEVKGAPILGNDLWEHAYYLKYQNRRADYLSAWWDLVDWAEVSKRFDAAKSAAN
ncbi:superoxide dismutase [Hyphomicrobium sp. D-2]|uniref:superoxide dismutase n=1 Tax=Hyphomicrobium sp. D-2 TaxID=3041621 RepID=UPI002458BC60|nr:superoxide dismutase [Hyphomicrobium sp. D-2]MDH4982398.1 superoxide dismutase [Hyphomicrobium sp. D-2]